MAASACRRRTPSTSTTGRRSAPRSRSTTSRRSHLAGRLGHPPLPASAARLPAATRGGTEAAQTRRDAPGCRWPRRVPGPWVAVRRRRPARVTYSSRTRDLAPGTALASYSRRCPLGGAALEEVLDRLDAALRLLA